MQRTPTRPFPLGLIAALLAQVVLFGGCGSNAVDPVTGQAPPKDRMEALQRLQQANIKHDQGAPPNQRSGATKTTKK